ncbi:hypothetical protein [Bacteroides sp. 224]|uniref:hypothetical protein n=1 Tax=Bacteroides sp. 224 TaxID=2302936 RepID=UPI0013D8286E|nr:hypothetical protein [Bacteroides sp. 224]NDV63950.1 hypothetical protein [Bacteroides sp. 224]
MLVNNVAYSWAMIELTAPALTGSANANSQILQGVSGIKWNIKHKVETNYGLGGEPVNRGFGNTEYTASITMDYNTQVMLRALKGSLMALGEFDLVISFANQLGTTDWTTETITLKGCLFNEDGMEAQQDDTSLTKEFDLNPFKIIPSTTAA